MNGTDWSKHADLGGLRAVIDPGDTLGFKNRLIDSIHWLGLATKLRNAKRLLDFGCGTGRFASRIVGAGIDYTGVDRSMDMISAAKEEHSRTGISFVSYDDATLPFADGSFDTIFCCWVYQYIVRTPAGPPLLAELQRVLTPGGSLILIEQASQTNQSSGTVSRSASERDYVSELSDCFDVESVEKLRMCIFSDLSRFALRAFRHCALLSRPVMPLLARWEISRARRAKSTSYMDIPYYDVCVEALSREEGPEYGQ